MKLSPNELQSEKSRVDHDNYNQFIKRVHLKKIRGFIDQSIDYRFPVTALIGTNGGGKSTILGASALAYKNIRPGQFFPKSFVGDNSMADWLVEFELVDKKTNQNQKISRSARFTQLKWRRDGLPERHVEYVEIQRTVPAGEIPKFRRFIGQSSELIVEKELSRDTVTYASSVLNRDISSYRVVHIADSPENKIYVGKIKEIGYSQFHFGAGEASIIATIDRIENAPK